MPCPVMAAVGDCVRLWPTSARFVRPTHGLDVVTAYPTYGVRSISVRASMPADEALIAVGRDITQHWTADGDNDDAGM